ncbi:hypothetical protein [Paenibacillus sp. J2TS4]|uniref:hypothetical protein n=1 Tax=Paenibacillus sp. J2TS4 TaxID=2807194 RepID=UPI001BCC8A8E|nr:hypothetical protein [Paenibacillus sp. J2TS4]
MYSFKSLNTDMELFAAALLQRKVSVWTKTADDIYALLDDGGIIEKITPDCVVIRFSDARDSKEYYLREECDFRIE